MKLTRQNLKDYPFIPGIIERNKKKLQYYKDHPPVAEHGKVIGSNAEYPYQLKSFTVSGPNIADDREWIQKCRYLEITIAEETRLLKEVKAAIEELIAGITDLRDKTVFEMLVIEGKTQQQVAIACHMDQATVSRTIGKYVED